MGANYFITSIVNYIRNSSYLKYDFVIKNEDKFEKWYVKNYGRLPDIHLIEELSPIVANLESDLETKKGALKYEQRILETFESAAKAWNSLKK